MTIERVIQKWWNDTIDVNDLAGSLKTALSAAGYQIVKVKHSKRKPFVIGDEQDSVY